METNYYFKKAYYNKNNKQKLCTQHINLRAL